MALLAVLMLGVSPYLQARHLSSDCGTTAGASCCCCSDSGQRDKSTPAGGMSGKCGCEMSSREPSQQAPVETQYRPQGNAPFAAAETMSSVWKAMVPTIRTPVQPVTPKVLGPPLYISKSSLLI